MRREGCVRVQMEVAKGKGYEQKKMWVSQTAKRGQVQEEAKASYKAGCSTAFLNVNDLRNIGSNSWDESVFVYHSEVEKSSNKSSLLSDVVHLRTVQANSVPVQNFCSSTTSSYFDALPSCLLH